MLKQPKRQNCEEGMHERVVQARSLREISAWIFFELLFCGRQI